MEKSLEGDFVTSASFQEALIKKQSLYEVNGEAKLEWDELILTPKMSPLIRLIYLVLPEISATSIKAWAARNNVQGDWMKYVFWAEDYLFTLSDLRMSMAQSPSKLSRELIFLKLLSLKNILKKLKFPDSDYISKLHQKIANFKKFKTFEQLRATVKAISALKSEASELNADSDAIDIVLPLKLKPKETIPGIQFRLPIKGHLISEIFSSDEDEMSDFSLHNLDKKLKQEHPSTSQMPIIETKAELSGEDSGSDSSDTEEPSTAMEIDTEVESLSDDGSEKSSKFVSFKNELKKHLKK